MKKEEIRRLIKAHKSILSDREKEEASRNAFGMLEKTKPFIMAMNILLYNSLPDELSTHEFIDKWYGRKKIFLPRVNGEDLDILPYDRSSVKPGAFGIEEPQGDNVADLSEVGLIVVPGIAYDLKGNRIGRGRGYYDRLLNGTDIPKIGMAYHFQLLDEIETEPHDVKVDMVITDKGIFYPE